MRGSRSRAASFAGGARIELLPLLDVVFLVLAVFLLSVVRMVRSYSVPVELPRMATGDELRLPAVLLLGVDQDGRWSLGGRAIERDALREGIEARILADPELQVLLQADRRATHGDVSALLDAVRGVGVERVMMVAEPSAAVEAPGAVPLDGGGER